MKAIIAVGALLVLLAAACGGGGSSRSSPVVFAPTATVTTLRTTLAATIPLDQQSATVSAIVHDAQAAVGLAREQYSVCPPYCALKDIASLEYTETTVGKVRGLLGEAALVRLSASDDAPVWAVVAHGSFHAFCMGCEQHSYPVGSNWWVFVLRDAYSFTEYPTDENHDIGELGDVHQVPLPLPPWPTPVALTP